MAVPGGALLAPIPVVVPPHLLGGVFLAKLVHRHAPNVAQRDADGGGRPRPGPAGLEPAEGLEGEDEAVDLHVEVVPDPIHEAVGALDQATAVGGPPGGRRGRIRRRRFGRGTVLEAFDDPDVDLIDQHLHGRLLDVGEAGDVESQPGHVDRFQLDEGGVAAQEVVEDGAVQVDRGDLAPAGEEGGVDLVPAESEDDVRQVLGEDVEQDGLHCLVVYVLTELN